MVSSTPTLNSLASDVDLGTMLDSITWQGIQFVFRRLMIAVAIALFFGVLGILGGIGYNASPVKQSITIVDKTTSEVSVIVQENFNPVLHPFHWLTGHGSWLQEFSALRSDVSGGVTWSGKHAFGNWRYGGGSSASPGSAMFQSTFSDSFLSLEDYFKDAAMRMATWGFLENLLVLFAVTTAIEVLNQRTLYVILFAGIFGFVGGIIGTMVGLAVGAILFIVCKSRKDLFHRLWNYLREKDNSQTL